MVIAMKDLKKLQEQSSIQKSVEIAESAIDKRIELTVLDSEDTYKAFSVVVGVPNSTIWSRRGPLFLRGLTRSSLQVIDLILEKLAEKYKEAGYDVSGPKRIDIGMNQSAPGIHIRIPNQLSDEK